MGFLATVKTAGGGTIAQPPSFGGAPPQGTSAFPVAPVGSFLSSVNTPSPQVQQQTAQKNAAAGASQVYQANAAYANSVPGLVKNTIAGVGQRLGQMGTDIWNALTTKPAPQSINPVTDIASGWNVVKSTVDNSIQSFKTMAQNFHPISHPLETAVDTGEAALGVINDAFTPITGALKAAQGIPGVGYIADGISNLFAALGAGGSDAASNAVDALPVSSQTKNIIRPLATQTGALVAQLAAGYLGGEAADSINMVNKVSDNATGIMSALQDEYPQLKEQQTAPTTGTPQVKGGFLEGVKAEGKPLPNLPEAQTPTVPLDQVQTEYIKGGGNEPMKPVMSGGEEVPSRFAQRVAEGASDKGFPDPMEKLPMYNRVDMDQQDMMAYRFVKDNPEYTQEILDGKAAHPPNLLLAKIFKAAEMIGVAKGDPADIEHLSLDSSSVSNSGTRFGQEIRAFGDYDEASPVGRIKEIIKSWSKKATPEKIQAMVADMQSRIAAAIPSEEDWGKFVEQIKCNY